MVDFNSPIFLKVINSAALIGISQSTICATDSLKEMSGKGSAQAAITKKIWIPNQEGGVPLKVLEIGL